MRNVTFAIAISLAALAGASTVGLSGLAEGDAAVLTPPSMAFAGRVATSTAPLRRPAKPADVHRFGPAPETTSLRPLRSQWRHVAESLARPQLHGPLAAVIPARRSDAQANANGSASSERADAVFAQADYDAVGAIAAKIAIAPGEAMAIGAAATLSWDAVGAGLASAKPVDAVPSAPTLALLARSVGLIFVARCQR